MRLLKLANWLSEGDLEQYKQQVEQAQQEQANWQKMESEVEKLKTDLQQTQKELAQANAQLQINQGFQVELGETQLKLQQADAAAQRYKKEVFEQQKQLSLVKSQFEQAQLAISKSQNWTEMLKIPVKIVDIQKTLPKKEFDTLWGFGIITPTVDFTITTGAILVKGWVLGKKSTAKTLRVTNQDCLLLETDINQNRASIAQRYPDISTAHNCGFEFSLAVIGISETTTLNLEAVLEDETLVPLCDFVLQSEQIELKNT